MSNNEPVHPLYGNSEGPKLLHSGITLRDYFAAKAMQASIALLPHVPNADPQQAMEAVVKSSYRFADIMLAEREK